MADGTAIRTLHGSYLCTRKYEISIYVCLNLTTMKEVSYHTLLPNLYALINCDNIRAMFVRRLDGRQQIADASQQHDFLHKVKEHRSLSFTEEE